MQYLGKANGPPRVPFIVKHLYGLSALASLMTFPFFYYVYRPYDYSCKLIHAWYPSIPLRDPPIFWVFLISLLLAFSTVWVPGTRMASKFIVRLVRYNLDHGMEEPAKKALLSMSNQLWFRDLKKNSWLADFIIDQHLEEEKGRYKRFLVKLNRK